MSSRPPEKPSTRPPPSTVAPRSVLGSRTTPTAFVLVAASLAVVAIAFAYVMLRPKPDFSKMQMPPAAPSSR